METNMTKPTFAEALWEAHKENDRPVGHADLYYSDNAEYFKRGVRDTLESDVVREMAEALKGYSQASGVEGCPADVALAAYAAAMKGNEK
jgi:tRNA A37 threonylcarbamoyladenosine biosynthesis protein TsaE